MDKYILRENLIRESFIQSRESEDEQSLKLNSLVKLMKERSHVHDFLSCIYFAGAVGDHPYFLKNDQIALGIAVLPEDSKKAGLLKQHERQTEIIMVVDGSISLEAEINGVWESMILKKGDHYVINKNVRHKVSPVNDQDAVYVFVKNSI